MISNLEKYNNNFKKLLDEGKLLYLIMMRQFRKIKDESKQSNDLQFFMENYQKWYSESLAVLKQLLPVRVENFKSFYEKPKNRKVITYENYVIEDALISMSVNKMSIDKEKIVGPEAAIPRLEQQIAILKSVEKRFESSLFDIKQTIQADLFDSELDSAEHLNTKGFARGAGAMAGVVLEKHLLKVCENHNIPVKKYPTICELNDLLKKNFVTEIPQWKSIQHLADLRNLCDHSKNDAPTKDQIDELIKGTSKITKTIF